MCGFCNFINNIFTVDNFWSIAQTILAWYAIYRAVLIANEQIKISKYQAKLWEIQSLLSDIQIWWSNLSQQSNLFDKIVNTFDSSSTLEDKKKAFDSAINSKETLDIIINELKEQKERVQIKQKELDSINID